MARAAHVLESFEQMADASAAMLAAARSGDWDEVSRIEHACAELKRRLDADRIEEGLDRDQQRRKFEIVRQVLAEDAEIRNLAQPWFAPLQGMLAGSRSSRKLDR